MKKLQIAILLLVSSLAACNMPKFSISFATPTYTPTPTSSFTPTPSTTPTPTPTLIPTATFTPEPLVRVAEAEHELFNGDFDSAQEAYLAADQGSNEPEVQVAALLGQARIHYLTGIYPNALNELRDVIDTSTTPSQLGEAYYLLGETLMELELYREAAEAFTGYLTTRPGVLDAFINERIGDALTATGDYSSALDAYTLAVQAPRLPTNFSLELKLAQTYTILGDITTAGVVYDDIFTRTGSDSIKAQVVYERGQLYASQGLTEEATTAYIDAVFNYPQAYYSYLALVELVDQGYPVDDLQRGIVDYYAGQYGVALVAFDNYLQGDPADPSTALYYQGLIMRDEGDISNAIAMWEAVINGDEFSTFWDDAWEQKAYTQWAFQDDLAGGEKTLLDFVTAVPAHSRAAEFLFDAGRVAERDDRLLDAANLWQRVIVEYPDSEYAYRALFLAGIAHYRLGDYASALSVFQQAQGIAMKSVDQAGALFWIGKSQAALGDEASAKATWEQAASIDPTGYYSERARDLLTGRAPFEPPEMVDLGIDRAAEVKQAEQWMITTFKFPPGTDLSIPGPLVADLRYTRGMEFWRLGLVDHAEAEFNDIREASTNDPLTSYRLAVYLSDLGMYRQAILAARQVLDLAGLDDAGTLTAPLLFNHIRFGAYFPDLVVPTAEEYRFHPLFVWSTIRQESLFDPSIKSSAGAYGLMQIMPVTGQEIVSQLGWPANYTESDLLRPEVNLTMGVQYLARQRDQLEGDLYAALAAYNGGPGNAAAWQTLAGGDPDLYTEIVRFDETRNYIKGIYEVFTIYSRLYSRIP